MNRPADELRESHEVLREKLETYMGEIDVNNPAWAYGYISEIFLAREDSLFIQMRILPDGAPPIVRFQADPRKTIQKLRSAIL